MDPSQEEVEKWHRAPAQPPTPCNSCFCKSCIYHCILCFQRKGLGIRYGRFRKRRRPGAAPTPESLQNNQDFVRQQKWLEQAIYLLSRPLSTSLRFQVGEEKQAEKVETETTSNPCDC
uniref:Protein Tat n=1 Tax=Simian immunodeficiency virus TaxID=11723 RepID=A0A075T764_SIV|nr:tat [Simian immunodeficiency virus]